MVYVVNPYSGKKIKADGPIAKRLFKQGWIINDIIIDGFDGFNEQLEAYELLRLPPSMLKDVWVMDPITIKKIKVNGSSYKKLLENGWKLDLVDDEYKWVKGEPAKVSFIKNTYTNRKIKVGGKAFKEYTEKKLGEIINARTTDIKKLDEIKIKDFNKDDELVLLTLKEKAIKGMLRSYEAVASGFTDPTIYFSQMHENITYILEENLIEFKGIKFQLKLNVEMVKLDLKTGENIHAAPWFDSKMIVLTNKDQISSLISESAAKINTSIDAYMNEGSGWKINSVKALSLNIAEYKPMSGRSYIPLPDKLKNRKGLVNIKNDDNECFKWCVAAAIYPVERDRNRVSKYKESSKQLKFIDIDFPVKVTDIQKFEKQNGISVNLYGYDDKDDVYPLQITKGVNEKHVNLLLISNETTQHYLLISDFDAFTGKNGNHKGYSCRYCLHRFKGSERGKVLRDEHELNCSTNEAVKIKLPKNEFISFKNYANQLKLPFVIYADFESYNIPIHTCKPNPKQSYTINYQKQEPNSFCYYIKCIDDKYSKLVTYRGPDAAKEFVKALACETKNLYRILKKVEQMIFTKEDKKCYDSTNICHICNTEITDNKKVRDHCHITGKFRGAAHENCNLNFRYPNFIPVFFHNLSGYDSHLFIKEFGEIEGKLDCIPNTDERYISFSHDVIVNEFTKFVDNKPKHIQIKLKLRFLDSFKFMSTSLEKLVNNLNDDDLTNLKKHFDDEKIHLVKKKGIYPYDYVNCEDKFKETKLPSKDKFYNRLNNEDVTTEEYLHAKEVWKAFECKNFGEYHDIYLKTDVLLLADVFEKFRTICIDIYKLDPAHYFTAPGLSWDALLKQSKVNLELLSDPDMILFIERGIRGGISMISNKHSQANNKYMNTYDFKQDSKYIMYYDANNLYGWAMSQYLPTSNFKWVEDDIDINKISDENDKGYILEVDLEYPSDTHDLHSDYPLAAEKLKINDNWLSSYTESIKPKNNVKVEKLVPNLYNKTKYIIHYRNLKQCIALGMKLTKIHRVLEFTQSPWMKSYIDLNTEMRKKAKNEFEKDFYKLMNNSVFGKTMENIRNRVDVRLLKTEKGVTQYIKKPNFKSFKIFSENLIAVHMNKTSMKFNKPIYVGMSILEISKTLMYDFHYNTIKKRYNENSKLLFTDTDSLCYEIKTEDVYKDMMHDKDLYDFSDYTTDHPLFDTTNKKVIGKMKDEAGGKIITEFVGLRSKMYCITIDEEDKKRAKGIKKNVVEKTLTIEDYRDALLKKNNVYRTMNIIRSINHDIFSQEINKLALSSYDDKRYVLNDKINTLAYGHYSILK